MDTIRELYSRQDIKRLEQASKRAGLAAALIAAATLIACVILCCLTDTDNAAAMEKAAVAVSVAGGWIVIYLRNWPVKELRAECGHAQMLLEGEREVGPLHITVLSVPYDNQEAVRVTDLYPDLPLKEAFQNEVLTGIYSR